VDLQLEEICRLAGEFGIPGIELRGVGGRMDMPQYFAEQQWTPDRVRELCRTCNTELVVAGSSAKLVRGSDADRRELLEFGTWADALGIPFIRIFGGGTWGKPLETADFERAAKLMAWWRAERRARGWQVDLLLETHDAFSASAPCLRLNEFLEDPLPLIWDSHHTWRTGGEAPSTTWERIGSLVRHVHLKDSVDQPSARHPYTYVLPGDGQMPLADLMALLQGQGFCGFLSLEWERQWHPYLPPLREALARLTSQPWFHPVPETSSAPMR